MVDIIALSKIQYFTRVSTVPHCGFVTLLIRVYRLCPPTLI